LSPTHAHTDRERELERKGELPRKEEKGEEKKKKKGNPAIGGL
jgi:hypothetical protein